MKDTYLSVARGWQEASAFFHLDFHLSLHMMRKLIFPRVNNPREHKVETFIFSIIFLLVVQVDPNQCQKRLPRYVNTRRYVDILGITDHW